MSAGEMILSRAISPSLYEVSPDARQIGLFRRRVVTMQRNAKPIQNFCPTDRDSKGRDTKPQMALRHRVGGGVRSCIRLLTICNPVLYPPRQLPCLPSFFSVYSVYSVVQIISRFFS